MSWCTLAANINQWPLVVGQPTDFETDLFNFDLTLPGLTSNLGLRAQKNKQRTNKEVSCDDLILFTQRVSGKRPSTYPWLQGLE